MTQEYERMLLAAMAQDSREAFIELYSEYSGKALSFIVSITGDAEASRDIVQDLFVRIWTGRREVSRVRSFNSYLFSMCRNASLDHLKHLNVHSAYIDCHRLYMEVAANATEESFAELEMLSRIREALGRMPVRRREVFMLSRMRGFSNGEIAQICGLSIQTVDKHITNALRDLRLALA